MIPTRLSTCGRGSGVLEDSEPREGITMKKVPVVRVVRPDVAVLLPGLTVETTIALASIAETMREVFPLPLTPASIVTAAP